MWTYKSCEEGWMHFGSRWLRLNDAQVCGGARLLQGTSAANAHALQKKTDRWRHHVRQDQPTATICRPTSAASNRTTRTLMLAAAVPAAPLIHKLIADAARQRPQNSYARWQ